MIRLRALGQCVVEVGDHPVTPESGVLFALLLFLSSRAGRAVPRDEVLDVLWPETDLRVARHRLRQMIYQLKKLGAPIETPDAVIAVRESDVDLDYLTLARNREALARWVCRAGSLEYLPRYAPSFSPRFGRWVEGERDRVRALLRRYALDMIGELRGSGDTSSLVVVARACLHLDPLNGEATFALAEALAVQGNRAEALGVLDQYRRERRATDAEADRATAALRRRIIDLARKSAPNADPEPPLVGRRDVLDELNAWIAGITPSPRIAVVVGEAGMGKTRLLSEGVRVATLRGTRCIEYRASAAGGERPLAALFDLLPQLLALPGAVGCSPESFRRLTELARGVYVDTSTPEDTTDSAFRFATLRRSVIDLVEALLVEGDVLLALDDAQGLDRPTLDILVDATRCPGHRFALLVGMRPATASAPILEGRAGVKVVRLAPLAPADARSIVSLGLAPDVVAERSSLIDWALDLADGNPFFLVELSAHCRRENASESLPESLQTALAQKIAAMSATARLVLQSCAILGEHSTPGRMEAVLALPAHAIATALSELETLSLVVLREGRVACRHDLVAEAVLSTVGPALGSYLHGRCAALLDDELRTSPSNSLAWDCARHWDAANEHTRALELTGLIVDQLLSLGLPREAADLCSRSERYCRTPEQHAQRLLRLSHAKRLLYDWGGVVESLEQRRAVLTAGRAKPPKFSDDEISLFEAKWWRDCDVRAFRPAVQRVADQRAPTLHRLQMAVLALIVADNQHRPTEASTIVRLVESLQTSSAREDVERSKARLIYHTAFGSLDVAVAAALQVVDEERRIGNSPSLWKALRWASKPLRLTNAAGDAVAMLTEGFEQARHLSLGAEMWNNAIEVLGVALDCENLHLAQEWAGTMADLTKDGLVHRPAALDYAYTLARMEYMRGDYALSRKYLEESRALQNTIPRTRGEHAVLALDVILTARSGQGQIAPRTLQQLLRLHVHTRDGGIWDFEAAATIAGFAHLGDKAQARALADYYMTARRSRISNHPSLTWALSQLDR